MSYVAHCKLTNHSLAHIVDMTKFVWYLLSLYWCPTNFGLTGVMLLLLYSRFRESHYLYNESLICTICCAVISENNITKRPKPSAIVARLLLYQCIHISYQPHIDQSIFILKCMLMCWLIFLNHYSAVQKIIFHLNIATIYVIKQFNWHRCLNDINFSCCVSFS